MNYIYAKCNECFKIWNISKLQRVPKSGYICPHCWSKQQQKRKALTKRIAQKALKYVVITVLGIVLYLHTAEAAEIERGYKAYGGEVILLMLPLWWLLIEGTIKDAKAELKIMIEEGNNVI